MAKKITPVLLRLGTMKLWFLGSVPSYGTVRYRLRSWMYKLASNWFKDRRAYILACRTVLFGNYIFSQLIILKLRSAHRDVQFLTRKKREKRLRRWRRWNRREMGLTQLPDPKKFTYNNRIFFNKEKYMRIYKMVARKRFFKRFMQPGYINKRGRLFWPWHKHRIWQRFAKPQHAVTTNKKILAKPQVFKSKSLKYSGKLTHKSLKVVHDKLKHQHKRYKKTKSKFRALKVRKKKCLSKQNKKSKRKARNYLPTNDTRLKCRKKITITLNNYKHISRLLLKQKYKRKQYFRKTLIKTYKLMCKRFRTFRAKNFRHQMPQWAWIEYVQTHFKPYTELIPTLLINFFAIIGRVSYLYEIYKRRTQIERLNLCHKLQHYSKWDCLSTYGTMQFNLQKALPIHRNITLETNIAVTNNLLATTRTHQLTAIIVILTHLKRSVYIKVAFWRVVLNCIYSQSIRLYANEHKKKMAIMQVRNLYEILDTEHCLLILWSWFGKVKQVLFTIMAIYRFLLISNQNYLKHFIKMSKRSLYSIKKKRFRSNVSKVKNHSKWIYATSTHSTSCYLTPKLYYSKFRYAKLNSKLGTYFIRKLSLKPFSKKNRFRHYYRFFLFRRYLRGYIKKYVRFLWLHKKVIQNATRIIAMNQNISTTPIVHESLLLEKNHCGVVIPTIHRKSRQKYKISPNTLVFDFEKIKYYTWNKFKRLCRGVLQANWLFLHRRFPLRTAPWLSTTTRKAQSKLRELRLRNILIHDPDEFFIHQRMRYRIFLAIKDYYQTKRLLNYKFDNYQTYKKINFDRITWVTERIEKNYFQTKLQKLHYRKWSKSKKNRTGNRIKKRKIINSSNKSERMQKHRRYKMTRRNKKKGAKTKFRRYIINRGNSWRRLPIVWQTSLLTTVTKHVTNDWLTQLKATYLMATYRYTKYLLFITIFRPRQFRSKTYQLLPPKYSKVRKSLHFGLLGNIAGAHTLSKASHSLRHFYGKTHFLLKFQKYNIFSILPFEVKQQYKSLRRKFKKLWWKKPYIHTIDSIFMGLKLSMPSLIVKYLAKQMTYNKRHWKVINTFKTITYYVSVLGIILYGLHMKLNGKINGAKRTKHYYIKRRRPHRTAIARRVSYAIAQAHSKYGTIGIKLAIYYSE